MRSASDCRLRGNRVLATTSQAIALMTASSWGGKFGLAAPPRLVLEREISLGPSLPPKPDGIGVESDAGRGLGIGQERLVVKEEGQFGSLTELIAGGATVDQGLGLCQELGREFGAISG